MKTAVFYFFVLSLWLCFHFYSCIVLFWLRLYIYLCQYNTLHYRHIMWSTCGWYGCTWAPCMIILWMWKFYGMYPKPKCESTNEALTYTAECSQYLVPEFTKFLFFKFNSEFVIYTVLPSSYKIPIIFLTIWPVFSKAE